MNRPTFIFKKYGRNNKLDLNIGRYGNGELAIYANDYSEGYPQKYANITVNLDLDELNDAFTAFIDVENLGEEIIDVLIANNLGELTGRCCEAGFVTFPEFKFNKETLEKYDPEGFYEYEAYAEALRL